MDVRTASGVLGPRAPASFYCPISMVCHPSVHSAPSQPEQTWCCVRAGLMRLGCAAGADGGPCHGRDWAHLRPHLHRALAGPGALPAVSFSPRGLGEAKMRLGTC